MISKLGLLVYLSYQIKVRLHFSTADRGKNDIEIRFVGPGTRNIRENTRKSSPGTRSIRKNMCLSRPGMRNIRKNTCKSSPRTRNIRKNTCKSSPGAINICKKTCKSSPGTRTIHKNACKSTPGQEICKNTCNRPQEAHFEHFWPEAQNLARVAPRRLILSISGPRRRTLPEQAPGGSFWVFLALGPELGQNMAQEAHFEHFWPEAQNLARMDPRRLILSISGPRLRTLPE